MKTLVRELMQLSFEMKLLLAGWGDLGLGGLGVLARFLENFLAPARRDPVST
jgi:hypothetical protein